MDEEKHREKLADNVILVSFKAPSAYILTGYKILKNNNSLILKARGKNITTLVNIAENIKREHELKYKDIKIESELMKTKEGREIFVSGIVVELIK